MRARPIRYASTVRQKLWRHDKSEAGRGNNGLWKARAWMQRNPHFGCNCVRTSLHRNHAAKSWAVQRLPKDEKCNKNEVDFHAFPNFK
jgi:hypothetical protein